MLSKKQTTWRLICKDILKIKKICTDNTKQPWQFHVCRQVQCWWWLLNSRCFTSVYSSV